MDHAVVGRTNPVTLVNCATLCDTSHNCHHKPVQNSKPVSIAKATAKAPAGFSVQPSCC